MRNPGSVSPDVALLDSGYLCCIYPRIRVMTWAATEFANPSRS